jgi:hypothetical protein
VLVASIKIRPIRAAAFLVQIVHIPMSLERKVVWHARLVRWQLVLAPLSVSCVLRVLSEINLPVTLVSRARPDFTRQPLARSLVCRVLSELTVLQLVRPPACHAKLANIRMKFRLKPASRVRSANFRRLNDRHRALLVRLVVLAPAPAALLALSAKLVSFSRSRSKHHACRAHLVPIRVSTDPLFASRVHAEPLVPPMGLLLVKIARSPLFRITAVLQIARPVLLAPTVAFRELRRAKLVHWERIKMLLVSLRAKFAVRALFRIPPLLQLAMLAVRACSVFNMGLPIVSRAPAVDTMLEMAPVFVRIAHLDRIPTIRMVRLLATSARLPRTQSLRMPIIAHCVILVDLVYPMFKAAHPVPIAQLVLLAATMVRRPVHRVSKDTINLPPVKRCAFRVRLEHIGTRPPLSIPAPTFRSRWVSA